MATQNVSSDPRAVLASGSAGDPRRIVRPLSGASPRVRGGPGHLGRRPRQGAVGSARGRARQRRSSTTTAMRSSAEGQRPAAAERVRACPPAQRGDACWCRAVLGRHAGCGRDAPRVWAARGRRRSRRFRPRSFSPQIAREHSNSVPEGTVIVAAPSRAPSLAAHRQRARVDHRGRWVAGIVVVTALALDRVLPAGRLPRNR